MQFFLTYFWFFGLPVGLLLTWKVWAAVEGAKHQGLVAKAAATRFTMVFACLFTIPYLLLGILQLSGGYDRPDYPSAFAPNEPYAFAGWIVQFGFGLFVILWVWVGNAAPMLVALARQAHWVTTNQFVIKLIVTTLAVVVITVVTFMPPKIAF